MKKGDIILILLILLVAGSAFGIYRAFPGSGGGEAVVYVDGEEEGRYSLNEDQTIEINGGTNILQIKNGKADMTEADCLDQLCVNQRAISRQGESIICLPHKVVVEVESSESSELDAVTN